MAKKSGKGKAGASAAAVEPRGKKIVFDEDPSIDGDASDKEQQSPSSGGEETDENQTEDREQDSQTDSDDDEAPEAVGFAVDQRKAQAEADAESARRKAKVERQKQLQAQREAEKKAKASKAAEIVSSKAGKSAKGKKVIESEDEASEEEFHTDSEEEEDDLDSDLDEQDLEAATDEEEEEEEEEGDESLQVNENDPQVKRLQARMQKAMEAAERRALEDSDKPAKSKSGKPEKPEAVVAPVEERSEYDMEPMPLPQSVLRVAAEVDLLRKKAEKRKAEVTNSNKSKKRKRRTQRDEEDLTTRPLNSRTAIQLLPSASSVNSLPPIVTSRAQVTQKTNLDGFKKRAMRRSGLALGTKANSRKPTSISLAQGSGGPAPRFDR